MVCEMWLGYSSCKHLSARPANRSAAAASNETPRPVSAVAANPVVRPTTAIRLIATRRIERSTFVFAITQALAALANGSNEHIRVRGFEVVPISQHLQLTASETPVALRRPLIRSCLPCAPIEP